MEDWITGLPDAVQVFDNLSLGEWVHVLRRQGKQQLLSVWKRECLERVHFVWEVDQQTALWHYHLHEARRYKVMPCTAKDSFMSSWFFRIGLMTMLILKPVSATLCKLRS